MLSEQDAREAREDLLKAAEALRKLAEKAVGVARRGDLPEAFTGHGGIVDQARQHLQVISGNAGALLGKATPRRASAQAREAYPFSVGALSEDLVHAVAAALGIDTAEVSPLRFNGARFACTSVLGDWMEKAQVALNAREGGFLAHGQYLFKCPTCGLFEEEVKPGMNRTCQCGMCGGLAEVTRVGEAL